MFLKCNNIIKLKVKAADILDAIADSETIEISKDKKKVRRVGNEALPEITAKEGRKKRDQKTQDKEEKKDEKKKSEKTEEGKEEDVDSEPELDGKGNFILTQHDFENP